MSDIEVHVCRAYLKMKGELTPLSLKIAKQFPIRGHFNNRWDDAMKGENYLPPICKVWGGTLDKERSDWLILVDDPRVGLTWTRPVLPDVDFKERMIERGGWYDKIEDIPTVIFF